jgi:hypothetical protein
MGLGALALVGPGCDGAEFVKPREPEQISPALACDTPAALWWWCSIGLKLRWHHRSSRSGTSAQLIKQRLGLLQH